MKKTVPILNLQNYTSQGNIAIDMVANAIIHERSFGKNPDAISLSFGYYTLLKMWVAQNYGENVAKADFFLDGVAIISGADKNEILQIHYYQNV